jgi:hypothetical protein
MSLREDFEVERMNDRDLYHGGPDGSQRPAAGPIGIEGPGDLTFCVGCLWCDGDFDHWASYQRSAS